MDKKKLFSAVKFATKAHDGQFRKGTNIPYIIHPLNVAKILIDNNCPIDTIVAGILHDTIEDTNVTLQEIGRKFGENVAKIVDGVTDHNQQNCEWGKRRRIKLKYLETAPADIMLVECADKLDNIRAIYEDYINLGESVWDRFKKPKKDQEWYYRSLVNVFAHNATDNRIEKIFSRFKDEVDKVFG